MGPERLILVQDGELPHARAGWNCGQRAQHVDDAPDGGRAYLVVVLAEQLPERFTR